MFDLTIFKIRFICVRLYLLDGARRLFYYSILGEAKRLICWVGQGGYLILLGCGWVADLIYVCIYIYTHYSSTFAQTDSPFCKENKIILQLKSKVIYLLQRSLFLCVSWEMKIKGQIHFFCLANAYFSTQITHIFRQYSRLKTKMGQFSSLIFSH